MKRALCLFCAVVAVTVFVAVCAFAQGTQTAQSAVATSPQNLVKVYYFHGNFRCTNCTNMEKWTKETIETCFKKELDEGKLAFEVINTETKGNEHFNKDYQLYTKAVVVTLVKDGKEAKCENLTKIWDFLRSKDRFCGYIQEGIARFLKEL